MRRRTTTFLMALSIVGAAIGLRADEPAPKVKLPAGKSCQGTLRINDKIYKLEQIVAYPIRLYDHDAITVLLSDQPIAIDKLKTALIEGQGTDDRFSLFQPNVKITFSKEGKPLFCSAWAANNSYSVSGSEELKGDLTLKDGRVRGSTSLAPSDTTSKKHGFDASFDVALLVVPIPRAQPKAAAADNSDDDDAPATAGPAVRVRDLPIPNDASDVEYQELVEQIRFKSKSNVKTLSAALAAKFKEQGWKNPDSDLVTPASAILKRTKGAAELTLFVKPDGAGSQVTIMSEGLTWEEADPAEGDEE